MKKIILLILLSLFFVACGTEKEPPVKDEDIINEFQQTLEIPESTDINLDLKTSYVYKDKTITAQWKSSNTQALTDDGIITQGLENQYVDLDLTLTLNDASLYFSYQVTIVAIEDSVIGNQILDLIDIPKEINDNIDLPKSVKFNDRSYRVIWRSNDTDFISDNGYIKYNNEDKVVTMNAKISYNRTFYKRDFEITIKAFDQTDMNEYLNNLDIPTEATDNLSLPVKTTINNHNYTISWVSNNPDIISNFGEVNRGFDDVEVKLTATMSIDNVTVNKDYNIKVKKAELIDIENQIIDTYAIPGKLNRDIILPTDLIYGLKGTWTSSNPDIISNDGKIKKNINKPTQVDLTLTVKIKEETMTHTFSTSICTEKHMFIDSTFTGQKDNTLINNKGKLVLADNALKGTYYSGQIEYSEFSEVVCSWAATSSTTSTCELFISLKIGDKWSDYISYGKFGLGLQNKAINQQNNLIELNQDEVLVNNGKKATGFQYKLQIERNSLANASCEVSLIALALNLCDYTYDLDKSLIKNKVHYDVPKLCQRIVPEIGGSICSATSSTMLLKYKGHNFSKFDQFEHRYIAYMVKDYGNDIFGNWVYNCVGMSGFGEIAYVKRFFGINEFFYSLQTIGPMAASVKGDINYIDTVTNEPGFYHTGGHLLVVTGYEITDTETYVYINDPAVRNVATKMTLANFRKIWRNVSYIIE